MNARAARHAAACGSRTGSHVPSASSGARPADPRGAPDNGRGLSPPRRPCREVRPLHAQDRGLQCRGESSRRRRRARPRGLSVGSIQAPAVRDRLVLASTMPASPGAEVLRRKERQRRERAQPRRAHRLRGILDHGMSAAIASRAVRTDARHDRLRADVIRARADAGSEERVAMSANTAWTETDYAAGVAKNENAVVITSSPGPTRWPRVPR